MLVCITIYNEERDELEKSLKGVYENIKFFNEAGISEDRVKYSILKLRLPLSLCLTEFKKYARLHLIF